MIENFKKTEDSLKRLRESKSFVSSSEDEELLEDTKKISHQVTLDVERLAEYFNELSYNSDFSEKAHLALLRLCSR